MTFKLEMAMTNGDSSSSSARELKGVLVFSTEDWH